MRIHYPILVALAVSFASATLASAQSQGPITPPPSRRDIKRIPADVKAEAPPIPAEEIIKRFTTKEAESQKAFENSDYRFDLKVVEYDPDGSAAGEAQLISKIYYKPDGLRYGGILEQPDATLKRASFSLVDLQDLAAVNFFPLTPDKLEKYDITYIGPDKVDEITAFLFSIKPKRLERRETNAGLALHLTPAAFSVNLAQPGQLANRVPGRNRFDISKFANDLEIHR